MLKDLIRRTRSYRRFIESEPLTLKDLRELVDLARLSASSANIQPLRFIISVDAKVNKHIFPTLAWAGYLTDWEGPEEGERPSAYVIILGDKRLKQSFGCDHGIAAQSMVLGATEKGFGSCIIGSVQHRDLKTALSIDDNFEILLVIAMGKPAETVQLETSCNAEDIEYWRDENNVHHVPKRPLIDLIIREYGD
jgi:nitroreductase